MLKLLVLLVLLAVAAEAASNNEDQLYFGGGAAAAGSLVKRDLRRSLVETEFGSVSSIDVNDGHRKPYHIQFITLEPNSLFLPVLLHADMVFYVHTGSGRLSWADEDEDDIKRVEIKRGDLFRLNPGSVFFVQSALQTERQKLRIYAIFATNTEDDLYDPSVGAYSSIRDLIRGFDPKVLRSAFKVSEEVIQAIINGTDQSLIVHAVPTKQENFWDLESRFLRAFLVGKDGIVFNSHKKKTKTYNIFDEDPDFENCNGWSLTVNKKNSKLLKGSNIGVFMVNLTTGSMMGPHWNPMATEIAIVLEGQGMVRVVCSSTAAKKSECKNMRFRVREGDVFAVPRFHPMAQMSFNNNSLVFMGFSTNSRRNHPQFLAGKNSVLQALDKLVLAATFNITKTTVDQLLAAQADSLIIDCTSCAEEEERAMLEEIQKEREEEEAKKREEEEARKREEEEAAARKREEEEAARQREEEAARKREEEEAARKRKEEEARQREEEVARRREEEEAARKREEEEEARQQEEEQAARQREEEQAARQRQEEAARKREEEAAGQQEEEQAARQREQEQAARQREEEEAARKREEEEARQREEEGGQGQGEEGKRQEEERERERRQQEEWERREQEAQREQEEARRQQEERHARRAQRAEQGGGGGSMDAGEGRRYLKVVNV